MAVKILKSFIMLVLYVVFVQITAFAAVKSPDSGMQASWESDSLTVSLLTCSPGQKVYEYYGHTALLVRNITKDVELVFNYGLFNFNTPHFVWRFMRGRCYYTVGAIPLEDFLTEYAKRGSYVKEDLLNLNKNEKDRIFEYVREQCLQTNWTYHYNFFYDNCATRVRDLIVRSLDGKIEYSRPVRRQSLRDIVHHYSNNYSWSAFGQDLLLGSEADAVASRNAQQFAPLLLEQDMASAKIVSRDGHIRRLVASSKLLVTEHPKPLKTGFPVSPTVCFILLLFIAAMTCIYERKRRRALWQLDLVLMLLHGLAGCFITFMFFFSAHPTVGGNWLILLLNPLPLVLVYPMIRREKAMLTSRVHLATAVWVALFTVTGPFMPQRFSIEIYTLALVLLVRSVGYLQLTYKKKTYKK